MNSPFPSSFKLLFNRMQIANKKMTIMVWFLVFFLEMKLIHWTRYCINERHHHSHFSGVEIVSKIFQYQPG